MLQFPMKFEVQASARDGIGIPWAAQADSLPPIASAIPPEFMGPGGGYSPESLFAMAVLNCIIATYKVYCEKSKIQFAEIRSKATLTLDRHEMQLMMTQIDISLEIKGASDQEKAKKILDHAIRDCAVSNSIKSAKTFHISVS